MVIRVRAEQQRSNLVIGQGDCVVNQPPGILQFRFGEAPGYAELRIRSRPPGGG